MYAGNFTHNCPKILTKPNTSENAEIRPEFMACTMLKLKTLGFGLQGEFSDGIYGYGSVGF